MKKKLLAFAIILSGAFTVLSSLNEISAQDLNINGTVKDVDGFGIPGITVQVKGTQTGTATDSDGHYQITVEEDGTLVFSGIGYQTEEIVVRDESFMDVTLTSSTSKLNELVVTALGIQRQEREIGYSTTKVDAGELTESKPVTVTEGLTGKVSGLQINTIDNGVDPDTRIVLRGYRHLNADNQALIVVDGVPVRTDYLSSINPNDIESVTVLKGASAAALYGVDATNGVITVTTKRGSTNGKPRIEFNNTTMFESVSYMPKLQKQFSPGSSEVGPYPWGPAPNAPDQDKSYVFMDPYTGFNGYVPFENQNYGKEFDDDPNLAYIGGPGPDGTFFEQPFRALKKDPRRAFFQTGHRIQNGLSYSGGDEDNSYFLSVQDVVTKGTVPKDEARRTGVNFAGKRTFGRFSADYNVSYTQRHSDVVGDDFNQGRPVYWNLMNQGANVPLNDPRLKDPESPYFLDRYYNGYYPNPWWQIYNSREVTRINDFNGTLTLNLRAATWANLTYRVATNFSDYSEENTIASVSYSPWRQSDTWETGGTFPAHLNGKSSYLNGNRRSISQDFMATFTKEIGDFNGTLIVGNNIAERPYADNYSRFSRISSGQLFIDDFYNTNYRIGELQGPTSSDDFGVNQTQQGVNKQRLISGYFDATIGYKNFLFLHGNFRRDWTSLLPKGSNAYNFWAIDGSWIFTDALEFLQTQNFLSYGKLRMAYSSTGDITVGPYNIENVFDVGDGFPFGSQAGLRLDRQLRNPNLKPEKTEEKEIGLEFGFLENRFNLEMAYYYANTRGQTFPVDISYGTGYGSAFVNAGNVKTNGFEFGLNATVIRSRTSNGLSWNVGVNYAYNDSKVLSMYGVGDDEVKDFNIGGYTGNTGSIHAVVGQPFPVIETDDVMRDTLGRVIISPANGQPILEDSMSVVGRVNPKHLLNVSTTLKWKHFSFYAQASYQGGNVFYAFVGGPSLLSFTGSPAYTTQNGRQRFIFPNSVYDDGGKFVPNDRYYVQDGGVDWWTSSDYSDAGTSFIVNAAYWKLRNVSLTYDFSHLLQGINFIEGLSVSFIGKNLLMLRPKQNVWTDPEFSRSSDNDQGITNDEQLPPTRQYGFSVDVRF